MPKVSLLGTAQDGGRPQPGCVKPCCVGLGPEDVRHPVSLGLLDANGRGHLIEATRALGDQLSIWGHPAIESVVLTHAHFGHVDGLGLFGRETLNASGLSLHVSASMASLIESTPQWDLMVKQGVFHLNILSPDAAIPLGEGVQIEAVPVPHRAELSDMHAFVLRGPERALLFLPDHDRWDDTLAHHNMPSIRAWLQHLRVDIALVDGTFWSADELGGRSQAEVPHPPVIESLERLGSRQSDDPSIYFIHLNHTNPLHDEESEAYRMLTGLGWGVGQQGMTFTL
jgi:pyrroloquinoline quinone biosynthesis protein B